MPPLPLQIPYIQNLGMLTHCFLFHQSSHGRNIWSLRPQDPADSQPRPWM